MWRRTSKPFRGHTVDDINYGIFLIMGNAAFISSAVVRDISKPSISGYRVMGAVAEVHIRTSVDSTIALCGTHLTATLESYLNM